MNHVKLTPNSRSGIDDMFLPNVNQGVIQNQDLQNQKDKNKGENNNESVPLNLETAQDEKKKGRRKAKEMLK